MKKYTMSTLAGTLFFAKFRSLLKTFVVPIRFKGVDILPISAVACPVKDSLLITAVCLVYHPINYCIHKDLPCEVYFLIMLFKGYPG